MRAPTSVGINYDFAAREPSITLRATDDELSRGVDVKVREVTEERDR